MKNKYNKPFPYLPLLIAGFLVILFSSAGIARIAGWNPISGDGGENVLVRESLPAVKRRCAECGVIVSMRGIELRNESAGFGATGGAMTNQDKMPVQSTRRHELTIRLADGSSRVINAAGAVKWRLGEHVIVIDGANPSSR